MNEDTLIWLFAILGGWNLILTGHSSYLMWQMKKLVLAVDLFLSENGKGAAMILHSPDDHLGIDELLERYIANHHDLSYQDWLALKVVCECIRNGTMPDGRKLSTDEQLAANSLMASFLAQLAMHKTSWVEPIKKAG
jgi:TorA maturation chaperone TorD